MKNGLKSLILLGCIHLLGSCTNTPNSWYWKTPKKPFHTVIFNAEEGKIVQFPKIFLQDNGDLITALRHNQYSSDAVLSEIQCLWFRSKDGGTTWRKLTQKPDVFPPFKLDPSLPLRLNDGSLLSLSSAGWENYPDTLENRKKLSEQGFYMFGPEEHNASGTISVIYRIWQQSSRDGGRTWQEEYLKLPIFSPHLALYGNPILTQKGTILQPMWGRLDLVKEPKHVSGMVLRSEDNGKTWNLDYLAKADQGPQGFHFCEVAITQALNGNIVALIRTTDQKELWTTISKDDGKTWEKPWDSGLRGSTPTIVTTPEGLLVAVYVRRNPRHWPRPGVYACVSRDHGQTWDTEHQVPVHDTNREKLDGYPDTVALPDGTVYTAYGFHGAKSLGATRFDPRHPDFGKKE